MSALIGKAALSTSRWNHISLNSSLLHSGSYHLTDCSWVVSRATSVYMSPLLYSEPLSSVAARLLTSRWCHFHFRGPGTNNGFWSWLYPWFCPQLYHVTSPGGRYVWKKKRKEELCEPHRRVYIYSVVGTPSYMPTSKLMSNRFRSQQKADRVKRQS